MMFALPAQGGLQRTTGRSIQTPTHPQTDVPMKPKVQLRSGSRKPEQSSQKPKNQGPVGNKRFTHTMISRGFHRFTSGRPGGKGKRRKEKYCRRKHHRPHRGHLKKNGEVFAPRSVFWLGGQDILSGALKRKARDSKVRGLCRKGPWEHPTGVMGGGHFPGFPPQGPAPKKTKKKKKGSVKNAGDWTQSRDGGFRSYWDSGGGQEVNTFRQWEKATSFENPGGGGGAGNIPARLVFRYRSRPEFESSFRPWGGARVPA